jgi:hypothetical protein
MRPAPEESLQGTLALDAGELMPEAEMDARAECQVPVRVARQVELIGVQMTDSGNRRA